MSNEPTTDQMNEAIALFDGWQFIKGDPTHKCNFCFAGDEPCTPARDRFIKDKETRFRCDFKYHEDWALLMPVIEKISKIHLLHWDNRVCADPQDVCYPRTFGMPTKDGKQVMVRLNAFGLHTAPTLIEAAHMAVYEVSEYHNNQSNTTNDTTTGNN